MYKISWQCLVSLDQQDKGLQEPFLIDLQDKASQEPFFNLSTVNTFCDHTFDVEKYGTNIIISKICFEVCRSGNSNF